jgi:hypothetical protein
MSILNLIFNKKKNSLDKEINNFNLSEEVFQEQTEDLIDDKIFKASDEELKDIKLNNMDNNTSLLQRITDELNIFCSRDLEGKGFRDCVQNNDLLNKDMNRRLIIADYRRILEKSIKDIELRVNEIDARIKTYESAGMTESVSNFNIIKEEYKSYKDELKLILDNENRMNDKLQYCMLSYDIGFNNGLKNNDNELK